MFGVWGRLKFVVVSAYRVSLWESKLLLRVSLIMEVSVLEAFYCRYCGGDGRVQKQKSLLGNDDDSPIGNLPAYLPARGWKKTILHFIAFHPHLDFYISTRQHTNPSTTNHARIQSHPFPQIRRGCRWSGKEVKGLL